MKYTYTLDTLPEVASKIVEQTPHKTLLFKADLGVGKTTLIKELAKAIGIEDEVTSPTFSIVNEYQGPGVMMYHFDFYRIEDPSEALDLGLEEYLESGAWNMMEWPENIEGLVHPPYMRIEITTNDNGSRTLEISPVN